MRLSIILSIIIISSNIFAADDTQDPNRPPIIPNSLTKSEVVDSDFAFGILGHYSNESDQINNCGGFGAVVFYDHYRPMVLRGGLDMIFSSVKVKELPDGLFVSVSPKIEITLRTTMGKIKPYVGAGVNFQLNYLSLNEPKEATLTGYDSTTVSKSIHMGNGFHPHLRLGLICKATKKFDIFFEFAYMPADYIVDIEYQHYLSNQVLRGRLKYEMPTLYFSLGIGGTMKTKATGI